MNTAELQNWSGKYKEGAQESVTRNNHMNDLKQWETIPQDQIDQVVDDFVSKVILIQDYVASPPMDFIEFLISQAAAVNENRESDIVLTDFINYLALRYGMDWALYTVDLRTKRKEAA